MVPGWVGLEWMHWRPVGPHFEWPAYAIHEGTLKRVMPIDITECTRLVCAQRNVASWCILSWGVLGWPVCRDIVGRVRLLTTSLWLVIALVVGPVIPSFPLLIVGGKLVWTVLLCKHLSQWSRWSRVGGLNWLHWWCIVDLWGWQCNKCGYFPHILLCWPSVIANFTTPGESHFVWPSPVALQTP